MVYPQVQMEGGNPNAAQAKTPMSLSWMSQVDRQQVL